MAYQTIELKKFLHRIERDVNTERPIPFTWLIGAGFSASAGIPLAKEVSHILTMYEYIGEVKAADFESEFIGFGYDQKQLKSYLDWYHEIKENQLERYKSLVDESYNWLSTNDNFVGITKDSPECYQSLFTHLLRNKNDHHFFLTNIIQRVRGINVAHIGLAGLLRDYPKWGHTVFTTNFDDLLLRSILSLNHTARIFGEFNSEEEPAQSPSYPQIVHLHGRHTGYNLLNTQNQISNWYNPTLKKAFSKHVSDSNLLIIGYSGWDDMVMQTLKDWNETNDNLIRGNLYWVPYKDESSLDGKVKEFLNACPHLKTFVITNNDNNLNADSFILSLCNSINKKNGSFAVYRKDILETAKSQHSFIIEQLAEYPDDNPQIALKLIEEIEKKIHDAENNNSFSLLEDISKIISQPDVAIELKAMVGKRIGVIFYRTNMLERAKAELTSSLEYFLQIPKKNDELLLQIAENQRLLAELYINHDNFDEAYEFIKNSIHISKTTIQDKDKGRINLLLSKICRIYIHLLRGNLQTVDLEVKEIDEEVAIIATSFNILGKFNQIKGCYFLIKNDYKKAGLFFDKSNEYYSKTNNLKNIYLNRIYQSHILLKEKNFDSALTTIQKTESDFSHLGDEIGKAMCINTLAYFNSTNKKIDEADISSMYEEAIKIFEKYHSDYNMINVLTDLYSLKKTAGENEVGKLIINRILGMNIKPHQYYKSNHKDAQ